MWQIMSLGIIVHFAAVGAPEFILLVQITHFNSLSCLGCAETELKMWLRS